MIGDNSNMPNIADLSLHGSNKTCYVMLCYVMLCYVMLCYVMLCYVMLCYAMLLHSTYDS